MRLARWALVAAAGGVAAVVALAGAGLVGRALVLPYAVQLAETVYGTLRPATGLRPTAIGWRQAAVTIVFAVLFLATWGRGNGTGVTAPGFD